MKPISPIIHGIIDYATVGLFLAAPSLLGFGGTAALLSYLLAGVHLLMAVLSNMPLGLLKLVPMRLHALVELIVGPSLIGLALFAPMLVSGAQVFFIVAGIAIFFAGGFVFAGGPFLSPPGGPLAAILGGIGLMAGGASQLAILTLLSIGLVNLLVWYGRLHYRLLKPAIEPQGQGAAQ